MAERKEGRKEEWEAGSGREGGKEGRNARTLDDFPPLPCHRGRLPLLIQPRRRARKERTTKTHLPLLKKLLRSQDRKRGSL